MAHDVFISYASEDRAIADAAREIIESAGFRCWIAPRDVTPGKPYAAEIVAAIEGCRVMVIIYSQHSNRSGMVLRELERAASLSRHLLPVRVEDVTPTQEMQFFVGREHWLDALAEPRENDLRRLVPAIQTILASVAPGEARPPAAQPNRPTQDAPCPPRQPSSLTSDPDRLGQTLVPAAIRSRRARSAIIIAVVVAISLLGLVLATRTPRSDDRRTTPSAEVLTARGKAEAAREDLQRLPLDEPLRRRLSTLNERWSTAEQFYRQRLYNDALVAYQDVLSLAAGIRTDHEAGLISKREEQAGLKAVAEQAQAQLLALIPRKPLAARWQQTYDLITRLMEEGNTALKGGDYDRAKSRYESAAQRMRGVLQQREAENTSARPAAIQERSYWERGWRDAAVYLPTVPDVFREAMALEQKARAAYNDGEFAEAQSLYHDARRKLSGAFSRIVAEAAHDSAENPNDPTTFARMLMAVVCVSRVDDDPEAADNMLGVIDQQTQVYRQTINHPAVNYAHARCLLERARLQRGGERQHLLQVLTLCEGLESFDPASPATPSLRALASLALARSSTGQEASRLLDEAAADLDRVDALSARSPQEFPASRTLYNRACIAAIRGDTPACLDDLRRSIQADPQAITQWVIRLDGDFDRIRDQADFQQFVATLPEW